MKKVILLLVALLPAVIFAQEFKLDAQIRPRFETNQGTKNLRPLNDDMDVSSSATTQRSRLNATYSSKADKVKAKFSLQDVRVWGNTPQLALASNTVDIHEAWGEILFTDEFSAKIGRQELVYDNSRILGNVGWAQQGRSFDLALLKYEGAVKLHAGFGFNKKGSPNYQALQFLWFNKKLDNVNLSFLLLNNGKHFVPDANKLVDNEIIYSQTLGTYITFKSGKLGLTGSGYYQMGNVAKDVKLSAYNALLEASFAATDKFSVLLGGEVLSGKDQDDTSSDNKSFNPFYGTNHKFNGFQDFFYVGNHGGTVGLVDLYGKLGYKQNGYSVGAHVHMFNAAAKVLKGTEEMSKSLGTEIDLVAGYKFNKFVSFNAGFSTLFGTETLASLSRFDANKDPVLGDHDKPATWGWLQVNINPTLFFSKGE